MAVAAIAHVVRPANWRSETWIYTALVLWLSVGSIIGATCVGTTYDMYSVGGQMMLLVGWYLLPLLSVGLWRAAERLHVLSEKRMPRIARAAACLWRRVGDRAAAERLRLAANPAPQRARTKSSSPTAPSSPPRKWQALETMRQGLPAEAVVLSKVDHHDPFACVFSGIVGRRAYLEYLIDSHIRGRASRRQRGANGAHRCFVERRRQRRFCPARSLRPAPRMWWSMPDGRSPHTPASLWTSGGRAPAMKCGSGKRDRAR